ncbi:hypothetical protein, partial [Herbaspirillum sp. UBA812]|uniref:hypothetical protein n=1 Tax=Herbaspirillum sp. UBA812 TaxID=1946590 RepID=UPI00257FABF6
GKTALAVDHVKDQQGFQGQVHVLLRLFKFFERTLRILDLICIKVSHYSDAIDKHFDQINSGLVPLKKEVLT